MRKIVLFFLTAAVFGLMAVPDAAARSRRHHGSRHGRSHRRVRFGKSFQEHFLGTPARQREFAAQVQDKKPFSVPSVKYKEYRTDTVYYDEKNRPYVVGPDKNGQRTRKYNVFTELQKKQREAEKEKQGNKGFLDWIGL